MATEKKARWRKLLKILTWILIILSVLAFYVSLRSDLYSIEYAIIAMVLWIMALGANYWIRRIKD